MPHVTFIHGLANKPEADKLYEIWLRALAKGDDPLDLRSAGVTSRLVYWADVLYEQPDPDVAAQFTHLETDRGDCLITFGWVMAEELLKYNG